METVKMKIFAFELAKIKGKESQNKFFKIGKIFLKNDRLVSIQYDSSTATCPKSVWKFFSEIDAPTATKCSTVECVEQRNRRHRASAIFGTRKRAVAQSAVANSTGN